MKSVIKFVLFLAFSAPFLTPFDLWVPSVLLLSFLRDSTHLLFSHKNLLSLSLNSLYSPINLDFFALCIGDFLIFFRPILMLPELIHVHIPPDTVKRVAQRLGSTNASGVTQDRWLFFMRSTVLWPPELVVERMHSGKGSEVMTELKAIRYYWFNI